MQSMKHLKEQWLFLRMFWGRKTEWTIKDSTQASPICYL
jgi:hypothetical protein